MLSDICKIRNFTVDDEAKNFVDNINTYKYISFKTIFFYLISVQEE